MRVNLRILLAVFLVVIAAGVVVYNVQYLAGNTSDDPGVEYYENQDEPWFEEDSGLAPENASQGPGMPMGAVHRLLNEDLENGRTPRGAHRTTQESEGPPEEVPLGDAWRDSVWTQLLASFDQGDPSISKQDPIDPVPEAAMPPVQRLAPVKANRFRTQVDALKVRGILYGERVSAALINDGIFHTGDLLPGMDVAVAEIGRDHVVFRSPESGETVVKPLQPRCGPAPGPVDPAGEDAGDPAETPGTPEGTPESGEESEPVPARELEGK